MPRWSLRLEHMNPRVIEVAGFVTKKRRTLVLDLDAAHVYDEPNLVDEPANEKSSNLLTPHSQDSISFIADSLIVTSTCTVALCHDTRCLRV